MLSELLNKTFPVPIHYENELQLMNLFVFSVIVGAREMECETLDEVKTCSS